MVPWGAFRYGAGRKVFVLRRSAAGFWVLANEDLRERCSFRRWCIIKMCGRLTTAFHETQKLSTHLKLFTHRQLKWNVATVDKYFLTWTWRALAIRFDGKRKKLSWIFIQIKFLLPHRIDYDRLIDLLLLLNWANRDLNFSTSRREKTVRG